ncbi:MAG TPA: hypothetical protein VL588_00995 [Bdellovibrionota bacterium]|nr:hypothetical protein [Bdellovibrionota bacterium]
MKFSRNWILAPVLAALGIAAHAAPPPSATSTGTSVWSGGSSPEVQVTVDHKTNGVTVKMSKYSEKKPRSLNILFFDDKGQSTAVELKATEPATLPGVPKGVPEANYAGAMSPAAQSFVGFEIRIPLGGRQPTVLRSQDLHALTTTH